MRIENLITLTAFLGLVFLIVPLWTPSGGKTVLENTDKSPRFFLIFLVGWFISLAIAISITKIAPFILIGIFFIILMLGVFYVESLEGNHYLGKRVSLKEGYIVALIRYWLCRIELSTVMKENDTYLLKLGFTEKKLGIHQQMGAEPLADEDVRNLVSANSPTLKEEIVVESGNLKDTHKIKVKINAPAFALDFKEYQVNLDELSKTPITIPCIPRQKGKHYIVFDFYDNHDSRRGGISVSLDVREKEPLLGEKMVRIVQISGGVLGLVSAIILMLEKVLSLFPK